MSRRALEQELSGLITVGVDLALRDKLSNLAWDLDLAVCFVCFVNCSVVRCISLLAQDQRLS